LTLEGKVVVGAGGTEEATRETPWREEIWNVQRQLGAGA
jgi:hypothetical protein